MIGERIIIFGIIMAMCSTPIFAKPLIDKGIFIKTIFFFPSLPIKDITPKTTINDVANKMNDNLREQQIWTVRGIFVLVIGLTIQGIGVVVQSTGLVWIIRT